MDPAKVRAVTEWKTPVNKKELQTFLGFVNFYRQFIKDYAKMSQQLTHLTGKNPWEWTNTQQIAFDQLKMVVTHKPILHLPRDNLPYKIEVDGSSTAMGAVLLQQQEEHWHTIAYFSNTYQLAEWNYSVEDRELLAIVKSLKEWRQYLLGTGTFEIWTDHRNLQSFRSPQQINRRQAQWITDVLSQFDYTLHHLPGKTNTRANALSQSYENKGKEDNQNVTVLPDVLFQEITVMENELAHRIQKATNQEDEVFRQIGKDTRFK